MRNRLRACLPLAQGILLGVLTWATASSFVALAELRNERAEFELGLRPPRGVPFERGTILRIDAALALNNELKQRISSCVDERRSLLRRPSARVR